MITLADGKPWFRACSLLFAAGTLLLLVLGFRASEAPPPPRSEARTSTETPASLDLPSADVFARVGLERLEQELTRFRLTGTFQTYDFGEQGPTRLREQLALVDDLNVQQQRILREGERLGPFLVREIGINEVIVAAAGQEWTLHLAGVFAQTASSANGAGGSTEASTPQTWEDYPALETSAWGHRIDENQWLIRRQAIFDYAEEMMANPRRAIDLYRSFTPARADGEEKRVGFRLTMTGERDFFTAMGLTDGDVIRRVNSMEMINQGRAEYLIGEFMKSEMGTVVLDIERDGAMQKLMYIIR